MPFECRRDRGSEFWKAASPIVKVLMVAGGIAAFAGILALVGYVLMALWNWLMPSIFGLRAIGYWEAWGIIVLSSILFKKSPSGRHFSEERRRRHLRERMREAAEAAVYGAQRATVSSEPGEEPGEG